MTPGSKSLSSGDKIRLVAPIIFYAVLATIAWKLGYFREQKVAAAAENSAGSVWVGVGFTIIYGGVAALALPVSPLAYAAGAVFGFWRGLLLVWVGSMLGAVAGYYLARGIWAKPAHTLLRHYEGRLRDLQHGNVFMTAFRFQLMPIVPFGAFNYAAAISRFSPLRFFGGTAVGIIPGTLMAVFIGDRVVAGVYGTSRKPYLFAGLALLGLLALSFAPKLWDKSRRRARKAS